MPKLSIPQQYQKDILFFRKNHYYFIYPKWSTTSGKGHLVMDKPKYPATDKSPEDDSGLAQPTSLLLSLPVTYLAGYITGSCSPSGKFPNNLFET